MKKFGISLIFPVLVASIAMVSALSVSQAVASESRRVLPLKVICADPDECQAEQLTQAVIRKLVKYPDVRLMPVPGDDPLDIMLEAGCEDLDDACLKSIGEAARADQVLFMEVEEKAGVFTVIAHLVPVSGEPSVNVETTGNSIDQVRDMVAGAVEKAFGPEPAAVQVVAPIIEDVAFSVASDPAGSDVWINREFSGFTPATVKLKPGEYTLLVKKRGYVERTETIVVAAAGQNRVEWTLEPVEKPVVAVGSVAAPAAAAAPAATAASAAAAAPVPAPAPAPAPAPVTVPEPVKPVQETPPPEPAVAVAPVAAAPVAAAPLAAVEPEVAAASATAPLPDDAIPPEEEPEVKKDPFYKTWWFWTIVGVAVIGAGTVAGILAAQDGGDSGLVEFSPWGGYAPLDVTLYPRPN